VNVGDGAAVGDSVAGAVAVALGVGDCEAVGDSVAVGFGVAVDVALDVGAAVPRPDGVGASAVGSVAALVAGETRGMVLGVAIPGSCQAIKAPSAASTAVTESNDASEAVSAPLGVRVVVGLG